MPITNLMKQKAVSMGRDTRCFKQAGISLEEGQNEKPSLEINRNHGYDSGTPTPEHSSAESLLMSTYP